MTLIYRWLRFLTQLVQCESEEVSTVGRIARMVWMVFPFGLIVVLLRIRHLLFGPLRVTATTREGCLVKCDLPDMIPLYIATFGTWEPDVTSVIRKQLRPGDVFIDVGANIGFDTLLASRCVRKTGRVVAIEADPLTCADLGENITLNDSAANVRTVCCAVSDRETHVFLERGFTHNRGRTRTRQTDSPSAERIAAKPLPDLLTPAEIAGIRMIKIDVEGAEPAVLRGLLPMLSECPSDVMLVVELSPAWWDDSALTPAELLQPFFDAGFKAYTVPNNYWPWRYMWPNCVSEPTRLTEPLDGRPRRIDLILTREELP